MNLQEKLALFLIAASWLLLSGIFMLPFLPVGHNKLLMAAVIYFVSQLIFWTGCALAGKEVMRRYQIGTIIKQRLARKRAIEKEKGDNPH